MKIGSSALLPKFFWTAGTFAASAGIKFGLNVALAHLLAPDIMGVMVVVNAVRLGIELLTDVGIEQNIVHHADGLERRFRDTAWTMQMLRGLFLSVAFLAAAPFFADAYAIDVRIFLLAACSPFIGGLHSTAIFVLVKQLDVARRNLFELTCELGAFAVSVALAYALRSVWAPALGLVASVMIRTALSYRLPDARQRLVLDYAIVARIASFGKWIALTSLVMYAATNVDRLYLGQMVPLALLGVYGIARAIADLPTNLARRMSYQIIFPALAGRGRHDRAEVVAQIGHARLLFAAGCGVSLALAAGLADVLIGLVYDPRYAAAGWMLAVLLMGAIFAVLSNLNEALILAAGRPAYSSIANLLRLATLAGGMTAGFAYAGFPGAVIAVALTELCQYAYGAVGLAKLRQGFWLQDLGVVMGSFAVLAAVLAVRAQLGLGNPLGMMLAQVIR